MTPRQPRPIHILLLICFTFSCAQAAEINTRQTTTEYQRLNEKEAALAATQWGITREEWREYESIMSGKRGNWTPGIDPLTALGVHASSLQERKHFAELYVKEEFKRVEGELAFQRAVNAAWLRLYPSTPRLTNLPRTAQGGEVVRYGIVVSMDCGNCQSAMDKHFALLENGSNLEAVDIYVVGTEGSNTNLRTWVAQHKLPIERIKSGQVTVNHGSKYADTISFPAIYAKGNTGRWVQL